MKKRVQIIKSDGTIGYVTLTKDTYTECTYCQAYRDMRVAMYCPLHDRPKMGIVRAIVGIVAGVYNKLRKWFDPAYDNSTIL